jgi:hypothetical protein
MWTATKRVFGIIKKYAKRHTFHLVMIVALIISGLLHFSQYVMVGSVYGLTTFNKNALVTYKEEQKVAKTEILAELNKQGEIFAKKVDQSEMELNSRLDIFDSTIDPDKKRKMLVVKIRNAIKENTNTKLTVRELNNIALATINYSYQYNLSIAKILAQMRQESNFQIKVRSRAGAQGLMQIMPRTMEYIELKEGKRLDPWNIYNNIRAGCFYMSEQITDFGDYDDALRAYNWGPDSLKKFKAGEYSNMPKETEEYVPNVNNWIAVFEKYGLE